MRTSTVEIPTPAGVANGFRAQPDDGRTPGVLLFMDAYGLRPTLEAMATQIAADGYTVLAPNLFYRAGTSPVPAMPDDSNQEERMRFFEKAMPLMMQLSPENLALDGGAYLDYLSAIAAPGPMVAVGYCMGVRCGWWVAAAHPDRVRALAGFHGGQLVT